MRYIKIYPNSGAVQTALDAQELGKPYMAYLEDEHRIDWNSLGGEPGPEPEPVYSAMPLTFEILSSGTITWVKHGNIGDKEISYSTDEGENWTSITSTTEGAVINVNAGDKVQFKGNNSTYGSANTTDYTSFMGTAKFKAYGNMYSLSTSDYESVTTVSNYAYRMMFFNNVNLVDAENLILAANNMGISSYDRMFFGCTNLTKAPALPAMNLNNTCYEEMFGRCTNLTIGPDLPAQVIQTGSYSAMFDRSGLVQLPNMSASTLAGNNCMATMFLSCTSLTAAVLPESIVRLGNGTAASVFQNMFRGCSNLSYIKCTATNNLTTTELNGWVLGVSPTGTFVKHRNAVWPTGVSGIPDGWTVVDADI